MRTPKAKSWPPPRSLFYVAPGQEIREAPGSPAPKPAPAPKPQAEAPPVAPNAPTPPAPPAPDQKAVGLSDLMVEEKQSGRSIKLDL